MCVQQMLLGVLFLFKNIVLSHLSFLQSSLDLSLLLLQLFTNLLQLMDTLSALSKLFSQVRNFLC